jgi:hypothetical protein
MIIEYAYRPPAMSVLENPLNEPEIGSRLRIQGDPFGAIFDGVILGIDDKTDPETLFISIEDKQPGVDSLITWLKDRGDLGIKVI